MTTAPKRKRIIELLENHKSSNEQMITAIGMIMRKNRSLDFKIDELRSFGEVLQKEGYDLTHYNNEAKAAIEREQIKLANKEKKPAQKPASPPPPQPAQKQ